MSYRSRPHLEKSDGSGQAKYNYFLRQGFSVYPGTHYVGQASLRLAQIGLTLVSRGLGLKGDRHHCLARMNLKNSFCSPVWWCSPVNQCRGWGRRPKVNRTGLELYRITATTAGRWESRQMHMRRCKRARLQHSLPGGNGCSMVGTRCRTLKAFRAQARLSPAFFTPIGCPRRLVSP